MSFDQILNWSILGSLILLACAGLIHYERKKNQKDKSE